MTFSEYFSEISFTEAGIFCVFGVLALIAVSFLVSYLRFHLGSDEKKKPTAEEILWPRRLAVRFSIWRLWVRIPSGSPFLYFRSSMEERLTVDQETVGSIPHGSTIFKFKGEGQNGIF